jgi:hypothetical protein
VCGKGGSRAAAESVKRGSAPLLRQAERYERTQRGVEVDGGAEREGRKKMVWKHREDLGGCRCRSRCRMSGWWARRWWMFEA